MGSFPYPRNGLIEIDYEFILLFKKLGRLPNRVSKEVKEKSKLTTKEWRQYFTGHWHFAGEKQNGGHVAVFPQELPRRLIKMFSFVGETILDPFLGSGTTTKAAKELGRDSIGYEINRNYLPIIKQKVGVSQRSFLEKECKFEIIYQTHQDIPTVKGNIGKSRVNKAVINNRINDPEYWQTSRAKKYKGR